VLPIGPLLATTDLLVNVLPKHREGEHLICGLFSVEFLGRHFIVLAFIHVGF
jgi:hypothetical protein